MRRRSIPMPVETWRAVQRRAVEKRVSASEIVRQAIHQSDWYFADEREQKLKAELEEARNEPR